MIVAKAPAEDLVAFLSGFDLSPFVEDLPKVPDGYTRGKGVVIYEQVVETEERHGDDPFAEP